ncbi:ORF127 [Alphabaculovirus altermyunipunctae]|uniref:ORF127 n=1 Tax=Mythimna unipuncta nucleopolyhedrovirus TaxID=447897 RepID=A0A346TPR3_9ABAC|nr:ORF127 [Mythimna unipuncta nucleopolyhedrovirus]AXU41573.1 ORF127 [Mythimna unipuncta nucleopolyhedrovirus]
METYASVVANVRRYHCVRCLLYREMGYRVDKLNLALNLKQPYILKVMQKNKFIAIENGKCSIMREADGLGFYVDTLNMGQQPANRCVFCRRVLHPLDDRHYIVCTSCRKCTK